MTSGVVAIKSKGFTFASFCLHFSQETLSKRIASTLAFWDRFHGFRSASDAGKRRYMTSHKIYWHLVAMATRSTRRPVDAVNRHWTPLLLQRIDGVCVGRVCRVGVWLRCESLEGECALLLCVFEECVLGAKCPSFNDSELFSTLHWSWKFPILKRPEMWCSQQSQSKSLSVIYPKLHL